MNILSNHGYVVNKNKLSEEELKTLKQNLTVTPKVCLEYGDQIESFEIYTETTEDITIPKYYGEAKFGKLEIEPANKDSAVDFEFTGKLRGTQPEVAAFALKAIKEQGGGLLQLHTGYGKTTMSLYLASMLKVKTLVIVHKSFLQDQWYDRIKQFTTASIGMIRQKKTDVAGKDIVIGMLQSMSMIDYPEEIFADFDLIIADECFPAYTRVITNQGSFTICQLYNLWKNGKELPLIKSYNETTKLFEFKKMTYAWEKTTDKLLRITFDGNFIDCTPNHLFLTATGYVKAENLTQNDTIISDNNAQMKIQCIKHINISDSNKTVYDIEVEDNHNFIVTGKSSEAGAVVHNCHHLGSRVFSKALSKLCPKYTIGLSATPNRSDGLTKIIKWYLGDTIVKIDRKGDNAVYVKTFNYSCDDALFVEKKKWIKGNNQPKPDTVKMITNMYKIDNRNQFVADIINNIRGNDERKTLVLSGRIEHLNKLKHLVDTSIKQDIINGKCFPDEFKTSFYIGKMKDYQLKDSSESNIIFATYSMAEEGLDIDGLNTLILATPKKNIIQSIGRIMRKPIQEGDINPLIIDVIDDLSCFKNWGDLRTKYYGSNKYTVNNYKVHNDKLITFQDYMIKEKLVTKAQTLAADFDLRKAYIVPKFGQMTYDFQNELNFPHYPLEMFNYPCDYQQILSINHDYSTQINKQESEITYYNNLFVEI